MEASAFKEWPVSDTFWTVKTIKKGKSEIEILDIGRSELIDFLSKHGFAKIFVGTNVEFIKSDGCIIEKIQQVQIKDFVMDFVNNELPPFLPHAETFTSAELREKLLKGVNVYFSGALLETLPTVELNQIRDNKNESFFFFQNCIAVVNNEGLTTKDYSQNGGHVWKSQIIDRDFSPMPFKDVPQTFDYIQFLINVSGDDEIRFNSLVSLIGYLLHTYKDPSRPYAVSLGDELISDNPNGGTGKGLFIQGIKRMRNTVSIDGKGFRFDKSFLWQQLDTSTQIVALEDVTPKFNFENLFSVITEGFEVEKKNRDKFFIPYEDAPKILITSNYAILGQGNSHDRRKKEAEFAPYYNGGRTPMDEFGRMFFHEWSAKDWQYFDNFMLECVSLYLLNGIKQPPVINMNYRKLKQATSEEFIGFVDDLSRNEWHDRKEAKEKFQEAYTDFDRLSQRKFNKWLDIYCDYTETQIEKDRKGNSHLFKLLKK